MHRKQSAGEREDDGGLALARGNVPVSGEQAIFFCGADEAEAVTLVEADGPGRGGPSPNQQWPGGLPREMRQQGRADAAALVRGANIGMTDESDVAHVLQAHHAGENPFILPTVELNAACDFGKKLRAVHVWLVPAVCGNDSAVSGGGVVDDRVDGGDVVLGAGADQGAISSLVLTGIASKKVAGDFSGSRRRCGRAICSMSTDVRVFSGVSSVRGGYEMD